MISRWQGAPRSVRTTALAVVVVLAYGTAVHVVQLVANGFAYYVLNRAVGFTSGRVGHTVITMLAIGVCAAAPQLWRAASPLQRHR